MHAGPTMMQFLINNFVWDLGWHSIHFHFNYLSSCGLMHFVCLASVYQYGHKGNILRLCQKWCMCKYKSTRSTHSLEMSESWGMDIPYTKILRPMSIVNTFMNYSWFLCGWYCSDYPTNSSAASSLVNDNKQFWLHWWAFVISRHQPIMWAHHMNLLEKCVTVIGWCFNNTKIP